MHFKNDSQKPWVMELSCYKIVAIHPDFVCISKLCAEATELNYHRIVVIHHDCYCDRVTITDWQTAAWLRPGQLPLFPKSQLIHPNPSSIFKKE